MGRWLLVAVGWTLVTATGEADAAGGGALRIRDGYFWDPGTGGYFFPRGPAYQTWNPPVFANQSFEQLKYDLLQFVKLRANSVRAEMVWGELEITEDVYDWSRPDFLVRSAEELGLKLFLLIGYQYPPRWFPEEHRGINDRGTRSDVLNYESPVAQAAYAEHIAAVVSRYKDSPAIGAWILGNEFAYFDLWEDPNLYPARRMLGYDPLSQSAFREWLGQRYSGDIGALNANWGTAFTEFAGVVMPPAYPADRDEPGYHDLIQWRKQSVAKFLALGAKAARDNDPNHLLTYSMVGGIFSGSDANHTCEDPVTIVQRCADIGAPLDFWSVNNYAWATEGSELRSADFGIAKYQELIGLPVMLSETGHSSTEDLFPGAASRQSMALPSTLWEVLCSGAIGLHFFHWNDRNNFTKGFFLRERGFGIVEQRRISKGPVFDNIGAVFQRMEEIDIANLLGGSIDPDSEVVLLFTEDGDMGFPRGNQENAMLWGALRRLGYQVGLVGPGEVMEGALGNARVLVLSRCDQLEPGILDAVRNTILPSGIHVHSNADLPGEMNAYRQANQNWTTRMLEIFGLDVSAAQVSWDSGVSGSFSETYRPLELSAVRTFGSLPLGYSAEFQTWKIWEDVKVSAGDTILTHSGLFASAPGTPALHFLDHAAAKAAINTFAIGDTYQLTEDGSDIWDLRSDVLGVIYRDYFQVTPQVRLAGSKAQYVKADHRVCRNGSVLVSLLNEHVNPIEVTLTSPDLLSGRTVENLAEGTILEAPSDGVLEIGLAGDEHILLYAYREDGSEGGSLVSDSRYRVSFGSAPQVVWPRASGFPVELGFDTRGNTLRLVLALESVDHPRTTYGMAPATEVSGAGTASLTLPVLDADLARPRYRSTPDGGRYQMRAGLERTDGSGLTVAESTIPVRLVWGVRPLGLPQSVVAGQSYDIEVEWEELPGYLPGEEPNTIDRSALFDSSAVLSQHYNIVLELRSAAEEVVASAVRVTREGTGSDTFTIDVPADATGALHWHAYSQTASDASEDIDESFEGWPTGEAVANPPNTEDNPGIIAPWNVFTFSQVEPTPADFYLNHGIHIEGSHGSQSIFVVLDNHDGVGEWSGFGLQWVFPSPRSLPGDPIGQQNYRVSFDYREKRGLPGRMDVQLKDIAGRIVFLGKDYDPHADPSMWDTMTGTVNELSFAAWGEGAPGEFDYSQVTELICVVQFFEQSPVRFDKIHVASIDNIRFDGPEQIVTGGMINSLYDSRNDSPIDSDSDGIADVHETGSRVFKNPEDTGTDPTNPDSDGDGQSDGSEVVAGTDPNSSLDKFEIGIDLGGSGEPVITWFARTGRRYAVEVCDPPGGDAGLRFHSLRGTLPIEVAADGPVSFTVADPGGNPTRLFRVLVWMKGSG